jgi:Tfp pilus assembly protein PilX
MRLNRRAIVRARLRAEEGFTLAAVMLGMLLMSMMLAGTVAAVNGDINLTGRDLDRKQAYEAAQAGIAEYAFHLSTDTNYWTKCTSVPEPHALNQVGTTSKRRPVPGSTDAEYAIELIPRTGRSSCSTTDPVGSMLETGTSAGAGGTFRIRATGFAGETQQSVVATFKRASFLDYVYFTQLETSDPITYDFNGQAALDGANLQCTKTIAEGRYSEKIPGTGSGFPDATKYCDVIVFASGENIRGPLHTNDALIICGTPTFGRTIADVIEVSSPPTGWYKGCSSNDSPNFVGSFMTNSPVLTPPPTNTALAQIAEPAHRYSGQQTIELSGTSYRVNGGSYKAIPSNGVIYVSNSTSTACNTAYSPYTATYPSTSSCGNVYVKGSYSGRLTIAAENDIIINGNIIRSGDGMLGLIANNFIRIYHPFCDKSSNTCTPAAQSGLRDCHSSGSNGSASLKDLRIDAAMLAINHSFIVDHYDCGAHLGTLTINGAVSQKFRGPVGLVGSSGYSKNYVYDDRLRYISPPYFLDPVESAWHVQRQTLDFP